MICYLDRTFCISKGCTNQCGRKLTDEIVEGARKWWGGDDAPISMGCFCGGSIYDEQEKATHDVRRSDADLQAEVDAREAADEGHGTEDRPPS